MRASILLPLMILAALSGPVAAGHETFTVRRVAPPQAQAQAALSCYYGNRTAGQGYQGWWGGHETYARLIDPRFEPCGCDIGFSIRAVRIMLGLDASADLQVVARLLEADDPWGCPTPGATLAFSPIQTIDGIELFGYYEIEIVCDFLCAGLDEPFFISVDFLGGTADRVNIVGGGEAEACANWNDWGEGWRDLVDDIGFQSGLTIWSDSDCCYQPIAAEDPSWGGVKAMYR